MSGEGHLTNTSLTLNEGGANEVVLSAPSNNNLFLSGASAGGVDLTGVNNLTCTTAFNQGSPLAGLCTVLVCASTPQIGQYGRMGTSSNPNIGFVMPLDGTIIYLTLSATTSMTADFDLFVNRSVDTSSVISLSSETTKQVNLNHNFSQNDEINLQCTTAGSGTERWIANFYIRFQI